MLSDKIQQTPATKKLLLSIIFYISYLIVDYFSSMLEGIIGNLIPFIFTIIVAFLIFKYVKTLKILKQNILSKNIISSIVFIIFLTIFFMLVVHPIDNIKGVFNTSTINIIKCLIIAITAGIFEEFLVRVLIFDGFAQLCNSKKYNLLLASIYSSLLFGIFHLSNLSFQSVEATLQQVFYAIAIGLMFCFIRLKTNGILICIILHSLVDFQPTIGGSSSASSWSSLFIIFIPLMLISILCIYITNKNIKN